MQLKFQKKVRDYLFERLKIAEAMLTQSECSELAQMLANAQEIPNSAEITVEEYASIREFFRAVLECPMVMIQMVLWNQCDESIQNAVDKLRLNFEV